MLLQHIDEVQSDYEIERNKPMPSLNHSVIQSNLIFILNLHFRTRFTIASELSLALTGWPSVPDLSIYPKMEINLKNDVTTMEQPPLCAIEIISPTQSIAELVIKAEKYFEYGVQSCWLVIPSLGNIYVFSDIENYEIFKSTEVLRDLKLNIEMPLREVFI